MAVIEQDLAHEARRKSEKLAAVFETGMLLLDQAQPGSVNQSRGLQGVLSAFLAR
jgi:hypothetical protein